MSLDTVNDMQMQSEEQNQEESKVQEIDQSVAEASEVNEFDDRRLERVQKLLDNLDST